MILYTKTVCPKCMVAKMQLNNAEVEYETVNLDENEEKREELKNNGFLATPILEHEGKYYITPSEISDFVNSL